MLSAQAVHEASLFANGDALVRYFNHGIETGSAFRAILENDLMGVFKKGDSTTIRNLEVIMKWLYRYGPSNSFGSKKAVDNHLATFSYGK